MNRHRRMPFVLPSVAAMVVLLAAGWLMRLPAQAAPLSTYYVAPGGDDANSCLALGAPCATIGAAVDKASDGDAIEIAAGTYFENDIVISENLTLTGDGAATTIVDGGGNGRVFTVYGESTLSHLTIQNGQTQPDPIIFNSGGGGLLVSSNAGVLLQHVVVRDNVAAGAGGGIFASGTLTIDQSEILSNTATSGGGLYNYGVPQGAITVTHSLIAHNVASTSSGGGMELQRPLLMEDSVVRDNRSLSSFGGGLTLNGSESHLERVTLTGNQSTAGAAIFSQLAGVVTIINSTVSGNVASNNYGGIYASGAIDYIIQNSTVTANERTNTDGVGYNGVMMASGAEATVSNSIIANNGDRQCHPSGVVSAGYNLLSDTFCELTAAGDAQGVDPLLLPLGDYGGPTPTHALGAGSPAIDTGSNANCPATDQRGVARPSDGDGDSTAVCDKGSVEVEPQITISGVALLEGTGGATTAVFDVALSPASDQTVTVDYATANGTATAPGDYTATGGMLTFAPGETAKTIEVPLVTDAVDEPDETFVVNLSNAANATLIVDSAVGTIIDDDGLPSLTISDVTLLEGNSGTQQMVFEVTLSPSSPDTVTVDYATVAGTATAPGDYTATNGTLTFTPGQTSKEISVTIAGDTTDEGSDEQFTVQLSDATNATLVDASGAGTITDDDTARLTHEVGPTVVEGDFGTRPATFTVTLSIPAAFAVTVDYAITSGCCDDGATAGKDFTGTFDGTLTFAPGETVATYSVDVVGDHAFEPDERFQSILSNANAPVNANASTGTIVNDDVEGEEESFWVFLPYFVR